MGEVEARCREEKCAFGCEFGDELLGEEISKCLAYISRVNKIWTVNGKMTAMQLPPKGGG